MIFMFVKSLLFSVILAPFNAFGQLYAEDNNSDVLCENYKVYSHISFIIISIFLTSVILVTTFPVTSKPFLIIEVLKEFAR